MLRKLVSYRTLSSDLKLNRAQTLSQTWKLSSSEVLPGLLNCLRRRFTKILKFQKIAGACGAKNVSLNPVFIENLQRLHYSANTTKRPMIPTPFWSSPLIRALLYTFREAKRSLSSKFLNFILFAYPLTVIFCLSTRNLASSANSFAKDFFQYLPKTYILRVSSVVSGLFLGDATSPGRAKN